jgi:hypothetical protein
MTLEEANQIWNDCYNSSDYSLWDKYTSQQRLDAIDTRQLEHERVTGGWGVFNISDRH